MGIQLPVSQRGPVRPIFSPCVLRPNGWMDQDATSYGGRPWPRRHCARWGPSSSTKKGTAPNFRPMSNVYCGQTAVCIRIPLGTEVGLVPNDIVLHGDPAPPPKKRKKSAQPPIFGPCLLWPNGCMYQDTSWYGSRPQPRRHCVRWGPAPPPNFQPVSVVAKWLDGLRYRLVWR